MGRDKVLRAEECREEEGEESGRKREEREGSREREEQGVGGGEEK